MRTKICEVSCKMARDKSQRGRLCSFCEKAFNNIMAAQWRLIRSFFMFRASQNSPKAPPDPPIVLPSRGGAHPPDHPF
jgi:hypothetical protein